MKKELFKSFIEQVAEIKELTPKKDPNIRQSEELEDQVRVGDEWIPLTNKSNPTLGFKVVKLKEQHRLCELGCGDIVSNQVIERRLAHTPQKHWRTRCNNCGCYVSPDGKGFIEGAHQVQAAYLKHFGVIKTHKPGSGVQQPAQSIHSEITEYERTKPGRWVTDSEGNITLKKDY